MNRYIRGWLAAGIVAVASVALIAPPSSPSRGAISVAVLALATALAEGIELRLLHRNVLRAFTLLEMAIVADLILLPPSWALATVLGGIAIAQIARRRAVRKIVWNVAQCAVATALALGIYHGLGDPGAPFSERSLLALLLAMGVYGAVNTAAMTGLIVAIEDRSARTVAREAGWLPVINLFGNAATGVLAVAIYEFEPLLLPFVAAPALALHLAYRGTVRSADLLTQVAAERDRLDRVVRGASDGIVLLDGDGIVGIWSPAMVTLTGIPEHEAVGHSVGDVLEVTDPAGDRLDPMIPLSRPDPESPVSAVEWIVPHRDGGAHIVLARHTLVFDGHGRVTADVVLLYDVTREREVERLKDDFIARASHELRTPLTPIRGFAEVLLRRGDAVPPELRELSLQQIASHAERMTGLIDDLLLVASAPGDASGPAARRGPTDLGAVTKEAVDAALATDPERTIELRCEHPSPVAEADPAWAGQVVSALLSNACKFSPADAPVVVRIDVQDGTWVCVRVSDQGPGIPPDHRERIFDRFHRIEDPLTMTTRGLGLGLYLARQLARRMGGHIGVESTPGQGSTFTFALPAADTADPADA